MNMTRSIAVVACSLGLAACSSWTTSWMPSFELLSSKPATATLTIESDPPGADASVSTGASCRTPCSLAVPLADALVSYELTGYLPQTVPVRPLPGESGLFGSSGTATQFDPNPVFAALQPATPSKPPAPPKKRKRPTTAAAPPPAAPPPSMGGLEPPPGTFTPMIR